MAHLRRLLAENLARTTLAAKADRLVAAGISIMTPMGHIFIPKITALFASHRDLQVVLGLDFPQATPQERFAAGDNDHRGAAFIY